VLGGILQRAKEGRRSRPKASVKIEKYRPQLEAYEKLCADIGEQPSDVALAWLLQNPVVTAPITGPRTVEQLSETIRGLDVTLSQDTLDHLDEIWPGYGAGAPEAYAW
jgi:aryl-alcohol dehydrogenase-like predicted oxidoreductase